MLSDLLLIVFCLLLGYAFRGKIGKYVKEVWSWLKSKFSSAEVAEVAKIEQTVKQDVTKL